MLNDSSNENLFVTKLSILGLLLLVVLLHQQPVREMKLAIAEPELFTYIKSDCNNLKKWYARTLNKINVWKLTVEESI